MVEIAGKKVRGRQYPWGIVDIENADHCDFIKLRTMLITHMQDLQEVTHDLHYENFRLDFDIIFSADGHFLECCKYCKEPLLL